MALERASVRLLMGWNGRGIGTVIPQMDARIASTLVKRGAAEYTGADKAIKEPVAVKKNGNGENQMTILDRSITVDPINPPPVSLAEVKDQLSWAQSDDSQNSRLSRLACSASEQWEKDTQTITTERSVTESLPAFPCSPEFRFYYRPVNLVTLVTYYDKAGSLVTMDSSSYSVDYPNGRIYFDSIPETESRWDAVSITYDAGSLAANVPAIAKQAILMQVDIQEELRGLNPKDKDASINAYENIVRRYERGSYP